MSSVKAWTISLRGRCAACLAGLICAASICAALLLSPISAAAQGVSASGSSGPGVSAGSGVAAGNAAGADFRARGKVQLVLDPQGFRTRVFDLDFSPDGRILAAAGEKEVRLFDLQAGQPLATLRGDRLESSAYGNVNTIAFSPDGRELLVGIDDFSDAGSIRVYDTHDFSELKQLVGGMNVSVRRLAFSRDGRYLAAAGENGNLYLWDWPARKILKTIPPIRPDQPIFDAIVFPTTEPILLAFTYSGPRLYSVPDGQALSPRDRLPDSIISWMRGVAGQQVEYPLGAGRTPPNIWDLMLDRGYWMGGGQGKTANGPEYWAAVIPAGGRAATTVYHDHSWTVSAVAASPTGDLAASADLFGEIHVWNRSTGTQLYRFRSLAQKIYEVSFDRDGSRIAYGNTNYRGSEYRRNHFGPASFLFDLPRRSIGEAQFAAQLDPQVERPQIGSYRVELQQVSGAVHLVAFDGARENARYRLPAGTNPMCYTLLERHGFDIRNPVIYGDDRGVLACWNSDTDRLYRAFLGHGNMITSVGPSPDGKLLVSSSTDGEICVFPLTGRQPTGHPDFQRQSDVVIEVKPGSSSQRAGVQVGDRIITLDGRSMTELESLLMLGEYPYRPGQQVPVVIDRKGQRFTYQITLEDGPDFVEPLLHLFITPEREWIVWTRQGYYDCSPGADRLIGWHVNRGPDKSAEFHSVQQFRKQLYRPDIIDQVIQLGQVPEAIARANGAQGRPVVEHDLRVPEQFEKLRPPIVEILSPTAGFVSDQPQVSLRARVTSPNDLPIQEVTFLVDGSPAHVARPRGGEKGAGVEVSFDMPLSPGPHTLGVIASNGQTTSPLQTVRVSYRGGQRETNKPVLPDDTERPNLFVLSVGIAKYAHSGNGFSDLQFADKDARAFIEAVDRHKRGKLYGEVETRLLVNDEATKVNIVDGFDWLVHAAKPGDIVMIFISAHGFRDDLQNYYLATHEVDLEKLRATAVSWREITKTLHEDFPACKRMLFLDTCHSGGVTGGQVIYDPIHDVVAPEVGTIVFASSTPREESIERSDWGHGAFTRALLDTLQDPQSDTSPRPMGDSLLNQFELQLSVADRVKELTRDRQHPVIHSPTTLRQFPLLQLLTTQNE